MVAATAGLLGSGGGGGFAPPLPPFRAARRVLRVAPPESPGAGASRACESAYLIYNKYLSLKGSSLPPRALARLEASVVIVRMLPAEATRGETREREGLRLECHVREKLDKISSGTDPQGHGRFSAIAPDLPAFAGTKQNALSMGRK